MPQIPLAGILRILPSYYLYWQASLDFTTLHYRSTAPPFQFPCSGIRSLLELDVSGHKDSSSGSMEAVVTFDHLCKICVSILNDQISKCILSNGATSYTGQTLQTNLLRSADEGCHLCNILCRDLCYNKGNNLQSQSHFQGVEATVLRSFIYDFVYGRILFGVNFLGDMGVFRNAAISQVSTRKTENLQASRVTSPNTLCSSSIRQIKDWITHCIENHHHCQRTRDLSMKAPSKKFLLPTRLLDVGYVDGSPHLRVRDTSDLNPETIYVTLSHCWGRDPVISLLDSNTTEFQRSIPLESLSKTFRDAVEVTRGLGYQYLWIDSLCIIQKSSDDWHRESAFIGDIYSNAILNIAATASVDGNGGLFRHSKSLARNPCRINLKGKLTDETEFICYDSHSWHQNVEIAPLARQAWVVQERMLSTRVVHFAEDQVYWECQSCRDSEFSPPELIYSSKDLDSLAAMSADPVYIYDNWERTIIRYTRCLLTFESDKFVALAGLAQRTCQQLGVEPTDYLAGIWRADMPSGLLWRTMPYARRRKRVLERAPSWSWACINGEIQMPRSDAYDEGAHNVKPDHQLNRRYCGGANKPYCQLISADISHLGDPFGTVVEGSIILKGPLCAIRTTGPRGGNSIVELSRGSLDCTDNVVSIMTSSIRWDDEDACLEGMGTQVYFLLIEESFGWCGGIVLRPMELEQGHYQRLGQILAKPSSLVTLLGISRNPDLLERRRYLVADPTHGFTIKIK